MKKFLSITMAVILSMTLFTACSSKENEANEAIIGDWEMDTYYELTADGEKDTTLTKYFMEKGVMTFNSDGTVIYTNGYENEWKFKEFDSKNNLYIFQIGEKSIYYMDADNTDLLLHDNSFSGGNSTKDAGSRSMTLEALNNLDDLYRAKKDIPNEGVQVWFYEKVK